MIEFYTEEYLPGFSGAKRSVLNKQLLETIKRGDFTDASPLSVANDLLAIVWDEYQKYGTEGTALPEADILLAQKTLVTVLNRLSISSDIPWRDFSTFRTYWIRQGAAGAGGWQARREILIKVFTPVQKELDRRENLSDKASFARAISPHSKLGWDVVDDRIEALRRRFAHAQTPEDYSDVGNRAVALIEALADHVYDPDKHVRPGEEPLGYGKTKDRLDRYIEDSLPGPKNASPRKIAKGAVDFSQALKHGSITTRKNAGLLGDSVILLANMLKRLEEEY
ncbi:hypothetical protein [Rothia sp. (in: high G+C Gram-positive bacteria)]|uniref:hypothetical protein n=1 Tax=Rothia sp. (in: high G+C Gram-positive bacteria) TaxID=1885016 RepID=UPI0032166A51